MPLRRWLILLSLLSLILPFAAYRYARQIEDVLKQGQEATLLRTAQMLGKFVAAEPELLAITHSTRPAFNFRNGDLFAPLLSSPPLLDGFADEWPQSTVLVPGNSAPHTPQIAIFANALFVFLQVDASYVRYDRPVAEDAMGAADNHAHDRVIVLTREASGEERAWSISASAPGPVNVYRCDTGSPWRAHSAMNAGIGGVWRSTRGGYDVELRIPLSLLGPQFAAFSVDADGNAIQPRLGWLHLASESLRARLESVAPPGLRVSVVDANGWLLARAGSLQYPATLPDDPDREPLTRILLRPLLGRKEAAAVSYGLPYGMWGPPVDAARKGNPAAVWFQADGAEPSTVRAAVPMLDATAVVGAVIVEEAGERLALLRDQALARLVNLTLMGTLLAVALSLAFAGWLSHRIRRLGHAATNALSPQGRIDTTIPDQQAHDELGDLARSYGALLNRVQEYTGYLQTLGSKLSHELRTPLTIVSSSLENLSTETLTADARLFLERAREGAARLHSLLTAMSEATRVEQSIESAERVSFDLAQLVRGAGTAYQQAFPAAAIDIDVPPEPCIMNGAPELIAQMLDKLIDNAVGFSDSRGPINLRLATSPKACILSVSNHGPLLPAGLEGKVFESMVSSRGGTSERPHLGLGLFIVKLIVEFHDGQVDAHNQDDRQGVIVSVQLPRV